MSKVKILARNWRFEVCRDPLGLAPKWARISGINSFTVSNDKEDTDVTDFDSSGHSEHLVAGRSMEISLEGHYEEGDPGQLLFDEIAELMENESVAGFRVIKPSGASSEYLATFGPGDVGGGNNDVTSWGGTVTRTGYINNIVNANEEGAEIPNIIDGGVVS